MREFAFVIDFTFQRDGSLYLLELGDFFRSNFKAYDHLCKKQGKISLTQHYNNMLRERYPDALYIEDRSFLGLRSVGFHDWSIDRQLTCIYPKAGFLQTFLHARAEQGALFHFNKPLIASFQNLVLAPELRSTFNTLQMKQKNTCKILNYPPGIIADACLDKVVFNRFAHNNPLCPPTLLINLRDPDLANLEDFLRNAASHYVLKPTNQSEGYGVELIPADRIVAFIDRLSVLAKYPRKRFSDDYLDFESWDYTAWVRLLKNNAFVLIQPCLPSKEIVHQEKNYRPTGRVVIEARFDDQGVPDIHFLASYWKLPKKTTSERDSFISRSDADMLVLPIEAKDNADIFRQLNIHLPPLLQSMYNTPFEHLVNHFNESPALEAYQDVLGGHHISAVPKKTPLASYFEGLETNKPILLHYLKDRICNPSPSNNISPLFFAPPPQNPDATSAKLVELEEKLGDKAPWGCDTCCILS